MEESIATSDDVLPCLRCGVVLPEASFYFDKSNKNRNGRFGWCVECSRGVNRARKDRDPVGCWAIDAVRSARRRAGERGVAFAITAAVLVQMAPSFCPALGIPLNYSGGQGRGGQWDSPSVDRILPENGYIPGNVIVVSGLANCIKSSADPSQILRVGEFYRDLLLHRSAQKDSAQ